MLMAGSGFLSTRISLRLEASGAPPLLIGLVATAYFVGLTFGSMLAFAIVARAGHTRAFAAFASLFSATSLSYTLHLDPLFWSMRSEEHTSELQSLMRISYAVFCLKKKINNTEI